MNWKGYLNCFPQIIIIKTYQVRPIGLVKDWNIWFWYVICLTCLIFSHMKCFYHKKTKKKEKLKEDLFLFFCNSDVALFLLIFPSFQGLFDPLYVLQYRTTDSDGFYRHGIANLPLGGAAICNKANMLPGLTLNVAILYSYTFIVRRRFPDGVFERTSLPLPNK